MSARSTCTSWTQLHTLWHLSAQGGESKAKSNQVSGRHEWQKRVKARERRTKRRTDTIGTREEGCKLARGDCQACRKAKASQASGRHAWRKHVGNSKGQKRLGQGRSLWGSLSVAQTGMLEAPARAGHSHAQLFIRPRCWATSYIEERAQCECVRECCIRRTWKRGEEKD